MVDLIRPSNLPAAPSVGTNAAIAIDTGADVLKATPKQITDAGFPIASEAQARAGVSNSVAMTPLGVRQAFEALVLTTDFQTREALVSWAANNTPAVGHVANAGGYAYRYVGGATSLPGLSGWEPYGAWTDRHFGVFGGFDATSATQALIDAAPDGATIRISGAGARKLVAPYRGTDGLYPGWVANKEMRRANKALILYRRTGLTIEFDEGAVWDRSEDMVSDAAYAPYSATLYMSECSGITVIRPQTLGYQDDAALFTDNKNLTSGDSIQIGHDCSDITIVDPQGSQGTNHISAGINRTDAAQSLDPDLGPVRNLRILGSVKTTDFEHGLLFGNVDGGYVSDVTQLVTEVGGSPRGANQRAVYFHSCRNVRVETLRVSGTFKTSVMHESYAPSSGNSIGTLIIDRMMTDDEIRTLRGSNLSNYEGHGISIQGGSVTDFVVENVLIQNVRSGCILPDTGLKGFRIGPGHIKASFVGIGTTNVFPTARVTLNNPFSDVEIGCSVEVVSTPGYVSPPNAGIRLQSGAVDAGSALVPATGIRIHSPSVKSENRPGQFSGVIGSATGVAFAKVGSLAGSRRYDAIHPNTFEVVGCQFGTYGYSNGPQDGGNNAQYTSEGLRTLQTWALFNSTAIPEREEFATVLVGGERTLFRRGSTVDGIKAGWGPVQPVSLRHFGAACDGTTNDGDAVKAASAYGGEIEVTGRVLMNGKTVTEVANGTTFKGRGKFIKTMYSADPTVTWATGPNAVDYDTFFKLNGASDVFFKCGFETTNAVGRIYGITATDCLNVIADGCEVGPDTGYGHMVFMYLLGNTRASGARKCFARNLGSFFVTGGTLDNQHNPLTFIRDFFCDDNRIEETNSEAIDVNFNSQGGTIHRNYIRNCAKNDGVTGEPVDIGGGVCGNISVAYNTILCGNYSRRGIWFKTSADAGSKMFGVKLVGNLINGQRDYSQGTEYVAVQLSNECSDVLIEGNTILGFTRALNTFPATGVRIVNNDITAHQIGGINGPDNLLEGNVFNQVVGSTYVALAVIGPRARIVNNDFNMQGGVCLSAAVAAPDTIFMGNTVKGGTRAANIHGARATIIGNTMSGQTDLPVALQGAAVGSKVKDNNMIALPASATAGVFISTGCNGFDVSGNYVEFAAASTVPAYTVQGACDGAILRGNRARGTTVAASGLTHLVNSLSEAPLLVPA